MRSGRTPAGPVPGPAYRGTARRDRRGPADLAALFGTLAAVASRQQEGMRPLLLLLVVSTAGWGAYGALVGSWGQVAFSAAYATFGLLGAWRVERQTHP